MNKNKRLIYIALLAAQGVVVTLLERSIPYPFAFAPGNWLWRLRLRLTNLMEHVVTTQKFQQEEKNDSVARFWYEAS